MSPSYKHIFFDLDQTLWDFDKNCAETLRELYVDFNLNQFDSFSYESCASLTGAA